jgi:hypothetical protein
LILTIYLEYNNESSSPRMIVEHRRSTFDRTKSLAVNNPFVEPAYDLRKPGPRGAGKGNILATHRGSSLKTPFINGGSPKYKLPEFEYM